MRRFRSLCVLCAATALLLACDDDAPMGSAASGHALTPTTEEPEDPRLAEAGDLLRASKWADTAHLLRSVVRDPQAPPSLKRQAERLLIAAWLSFEEQEHTTDVGCSDTSRFAETATPRMLARQEARQTLARLGTADAEALRARLDALDAHDTAVCRAQHKSLGRVTGGLGVRSTSTGVAGGDVEVVPYIDRRLGISQPSLPMLRAFGNGGGVFSKRIGRRNVAPRPSRH